MSEAIAFSVPSLALIAATVTNEGIDTEGAVNRPLLDMLPALADQLTAVVDELLSVALNCNVSPAVTVASDGEMVKPEAEFSPVPWPPPPGALEDVPVPPAQAIFKRATPKQIARDARDRLDRGNAKNERTC